MAKYTQTIKIEINGSPVSAEAEFEASKYRPATYSNPAEGGMESVNALWISLKNKDGEYVDVDVLHLYTEDEIFELIEDALKAERQEIY